VSLRDYRDRFDNAVKALMPTRVLPPEEVIPDPDADLANNLNPWASMRECEEHFLPWLEQRIEDLDQEEAASVRSHPDMLVAKGRRLEAKALRDRFLMWRGTSRKAPGAKE
jgi:hypothetical protein